MPALQGGAKKKKLECQQQLGCCAAAVDAELITVPPMGGAGHVFGVVRSSKRGRGRGEGNCLVYHRWGRLGDSGSEGEAWMWAGGKAG